MSETVSTGAQVFGQNSNGDLIPIKLKSNGAMINTSDFCDLGVLIDNTGLGVGFSIPAGASVYSNHLINYEWVRQFTLIFITTIMGGLTTSQYKLLLKRYFADGIVSEYESTAITIPTMNVWTSYNVTQWFPNDIQIGVKNIMASAINIGVRGYIY